MIARSLALVLAAAACVGCGAWDAEARARDRARDWIDCEDVELAQRAESAWRASGCGRHVDVACTTSDNEPECIRVRFADASGVETTAPVETTGGESAPSTDDTATSAVRASLDERREDVLACASSERVVVRVEWDATGAITLGLGGDLGGSAEEGCVRAALADLRAPSGAPGSLLHLVRR
ncbi:hypothetical protein [Sandaracinus amylolyticus]|uniref:hypothetical protein n=1 Tax=Sandaracinus amylolyticus TaxID=927083 RepID=UPI001F225D79|nr:hypothetical protein [Sandaracinus amylolyticus]UJR79816.1 Hypothetical protein I5071_18540 [Sandaracinus amylolyticus]